VSVTERRRAAGAVVVCGVWAAVDGSVTELLRFCGVAVRLPDAVAAAAVSLLLLCGRPLNGQLLWVQLHRRRGVVVHVLLERFRVLQQRCRGVALQLQVLLQRLNLRHGGGVLGLKLTEHVVLLATLVVELPLRQRHLGVPFVVRLGGGGIAACGCWSCVEP
jgi:hypothetical protein